MGLFVALELLHVSPVCRSRLAFRIMLTEILAAFIALQTTKFIHSEPVYIAHRGKIHGFEVEQNEYQNVLPDLSG